ncbi:ABC transporter ATP-binding protein [Gangjinia marincola]|uniref:ABC transporter ATP-binding protein n=1 Tax=Gangjinia marincola TaxID=578463 RepID=A0ABN1MFI9_9FLAO
MGKATLIHTNNLKIGYASKKGERLVADQIDLEISSGELVAIIGINGSGKSTLLKTLAGFLLPLDGNIHLNKKTIQEYTPAEFAQQISVVLTNQIISKRLTVYELIALGRHPYTGWNGKLSNLDQQKITNALHEVDMQSMASTTCDQLSDGQLQRVLLARALAQDTPIILLDEPTTHLDLFHKTYTLGLLKKLAHERDKTIIFASHEINPAIQLCDKIILVNHKKVVMDTSENLVQRGAFNQLFPKEYIVFDQTSGSFKMNLE